MASRKPDADRIRSVLMHLGQQDWIARTERRWWPLFLFYYTDLQKAVQILKDGCLLSRERLEEQGRSFVNGGSPLVLEGTAVPIKDCVRLYFRPKTPTQYHTEGIRSRSTLTPLQAHCPTPVFFLFNSVDVLSRADCSFSDGNLASQRATLLSTAAELERLPWKEIYHAEWFDPSDPSQAITFHRCAEVIVPRQLTLDCLGRIYCRSAAEKETLLHLLGPEISQRYEHKIACSARNMLFFRSHTFVETVNLTRDGVHFHFSPDTRSPGPFDLLLEVLEYQTIETRTSRAPEAVVRGPLAVRFRRPLTKYALRLTLDGHLAYVEGFEDFEIPF